MKILVTGGTGFIGRHAVRELVRRGHDVVALSRSGGAIQPRCAPLAADLTGDLPAEKMGADAFIHCAAYVGQDPAAAHALNVEGTRHLLEAARRVDARVISLSTVAVYGSGPHVRVADHELEPRPESVASRTRADAERLVLDQGGTVLRTALTYGAGDRWLVPSIVRVVSALGVPEELREVRTSTVSASAIARAAAACATAADVEGVLHVAHPRPNNLIALAERVTGRGVDGVPRFDTVSLSDFESKAGSLGFTSHQLNLLRLDHWYRGRAIWERTGEHPGPLIGADPAVVEFYRAVS